LDRSDIGLRLGQRGLRISSASGVLEAWMTSSFIEALYAWTAESNSISAALTSLAAPLTAAHMSRGALGHAGIARVQPIDGRRQHIHEALRRSDVVGRFEKRLIARRGSGQESIPC